MPSATVLATASGNTQIVAAPTSGVIEVVGYQISGKDSDTVVQLRSGTTTILARCFTPTTGVGGISCPPTDGKTEPYCRTTAGEALNLNLSGTGNVACCVQFVIRGG